MSDGMDAIVEVEREGMIYRAAYITEGKVVTVTYGGIVKGSIDPGVAFVIF